MYNRSQKRNFFSFFHYSGPIPIECIPKNAACLKFVFSNMNISYSEVPKLNESSPNTNKSKCNFLTRFVIIKHWLRFIASSFVCELFLVKFNYPKTTTKETNNQHYIIPSLYS